MTALVVLVVVGIVVLCITAVVIGVIDSRRTGARRRIAAERRQAWERRQRQLHGGPYEIDAWGDEDTD
ncbi:MULTISPECIES: hypothetical protein [Pseudonocardia]|uniref:Uncharacterized protein n=2 Tax=Pseudonocardia TaxID=1847 RepID=A0A1Y2MWD9_PSEAH|nr:MULTISPECIES: hypothetical protein [Pseudonocardia]OSY39500.1 hypothetical protein BG845_03446 [Pseudonocardia autotrophica]TDN75262.1 hypothetical protein C8E95_4410 [Pseudonocardia autotrophica]BBF99208.1 hypothetical protein Pdca_04180 [Pseudonocardia autotrophica]GEC24754.1 hypothetical protein PSA01_17830 [Pseudonocardia saturnea]